jgi:hypothetical protein
MEILLSAGSAPRLYTEDPEQLEEQLRESLEMAAEDD